MPEPWTLDHKVTLFAQVRTRPGPADSKGNQWVECEHTGLVLVVCNCGLNTGWIDRALMPDQAALADGEQHAARIAHERGLNAIALNGLDEALPRRSEA